MLRGKVPNVLGRCHTKRRLACVAAPILLLVGHDFSKKNLKGRVSYQKKDGRGHTRPLFFWYETMTTTPDIRDIFMWCGGQWLSLCVYITEDWSMRSHLHNVILYLLKSWLTNFRHCCIETMSISSIASPTLKRPMFALVCPSIEVSSVKVIQFLIFIDVLFFYLNLQKHYFWHVSKIEIMSVL